jgi:cell division protein FtsW
MRIAKKCKSLFPAYLIMGLALMLTVQAMINMAVAVGVFPVTGQPLPLISRGGTSTFINCAYLGMMLSVSRSARQIDESEDADEENSKDENINTETNTLKEKEATLA